MCVSPLISFLKSLKKTWHLCPLRIPGSERVPKGKMKVKKALKDEKISKHYSRISTISSFSKFKWLNNASCFYRLFQKVDLKKVNIEIV